MSIRSTRDIERRLRAMRVRPPESMRGAVLGEASAGFGKTPCIRPLLRRRLVEAAAVAAAITVVVWGLKTRSPLPSSPSPARVETRAPSESPARMVSLESLGHAFREGGLDAVERQLDRAFEQVGPWTTDLPEKGLL